MYGGKIKMVRELRGFSQNDMAIKLGVAQNTYSKYETNKTDVSVETLEKIAGILEVSPMDLISQLPAIVNFQPNQGTQQSIGHVDTIITNQKELYEQMLNSAKALYEQIIEAKDAEIVRQAKLLDTMLNKK